MDFYPRPPRGGRPGLCKPGRAGYPISIHALREEGDFPFCDFIILYFQFLSTPSARRATYRILVLCVALKISIHALREEGDPFKSASRDVQARFLSTPSARRATRRRCRETTDQRYFYPRPPRGGRLTDVVKQRVDFLISIHALREEGDASAVQGDNRPKIFLSTPSARRATTRPRRA